MSSAPILVSEYLKISMVANNFFSSLFEFSSITLKSVFMVNFGPPVCVYVCMCVLLVLFGRFRKIDEPLMIDEIVGYLSINFQSNQVIKVVNWKVVDKCTREIYMCALCILSCTNMWPV